MFFLQPLWLWASAVLLVPVIIHLLNLSKGKVLRIGSTAFIPESSRKSSRRIKLSQWILLALRCLLIALLSLLLAQPRWKANLKDTRESGWILTDGNFGPKQLSEHKTLIDSLHKAGFVFKTWDTSLTTIGYARWEQSLSDGKTVNELKPWQMVNELNRKLNGNFPVYFFAGNQLRDYSGLRPFAAKGLQWIFYEKKDSLLQSIISARITNADSVTLISSISEKSGTKMNVQRISFLQPADDITFTREQEGLFVALKNQAPVVVDTGKLKVTIVSNATENDAEYLQSALEAIEKITTIDISLEIKKTADAISANQDWIFWLSEEDVPPDAKAENIFRYSTGKSEGIHSRLINNQDNPSQQADISLYRVRQKNVVEKDIETIHWTDGYGRPLMYEIKAPRSVFIFNSRFQPEWNDLVWNENFPLWILNMITNDRDIRIDPDADFRMIDEAQAKPLTGEQEIVAQMNVPGWSDLSDWTWMILFAVFFVERFLSTKQKMRSA